MELGSRSFFGGGCYNQDIFKDPKKRHDHDVSVLSYSNILYIIRISHLYFPASAQAVVKGVVPSTPRFLPSIFYRA